MGFRTKNPARAMGFFSGLRIVRTMVRILNSKFLILNCIALSLSVPAEAAEHRGVVSTSGVPVPGASITATQGETKVATVSEADGSYRFSDLGDGVWTITVSMLGFSPLTETITVPPPTQENPRAWEL